MQNTDNILKKLYTTVFSQTFSPDGKMKKKNSYLFFLISKIIIINKGELLAAGDNFGNLYLYRYCKMKKNLITLKFLISKLCYNFRLSSVLNTENIEKIKLPYSKIKSLF